MLSKPTSASKNSTAKKSATPNKNSTAAKAKVTQPKASSKQATSSTAPTKLRLSSFLSPTKGSGVTKSSTTSKGTCLPKKAARKGEEIEAGVEETETPKQGAKATEKNGKKTASRSKPKGARNPSDIRIYDASPLKLKPSSSEVSVLMRPTERTKRFLAQLEDERKKRGAAAAAILPNAEEKEDGMQTFRVMDLPKEVQVAIWREAVVYPDFFVWPESKTGGEQPDLAMVGREVREDVLGVYYGENIFAVNLSPIRVLDMRGPRAKVFKGAKLSAMGALRIWSSLMEQKGWFGMIRKWVFSYAPPSTRCGFGIRGGGQVEQNFVVFVNFKPEQRKDESKTWSAVVEVHRRANCVIPAAVNCGQCIVRAAPEWLNKAVFEAMDGADAGGIKAKSVVTLAETIRSRAAELKDEKCVGSNGDTGVV
ncbi:hypothetical protein BDY17DRAFT_69254 [Neohortaea acidophila]|uniref:Uncharacterized protein n=1 Tax=Neohortaea acidophila TaxID=245834 RepID=A0A6A6Q1Y5_9PEZI|nr:uncharacterized protein BDY17DRAFT_69254 [Neohortaea acidophila]KAF2485994.1 hypothetical protein BDY17DRAFT_69254 [Neohortaea acidophila]